MKVDAMKFGVSGAVTCGVFYTLGAILVKWAPAWSLKMAASLMYLKNLDYLMPNLGVCWGSFIMGLIATLIVCFVFFWHIAWLYNKLLK